MGRRLHDIFWTIFAWDVMFFTTQTFLSVVYCGVRTNPRVPDPRLYQLQDDLPTGGAGSLFRLPLLLLGSTRRARIEDAVRDR